MFLGPLAARAYLRENWTPTGGGGVAWNLAARTPSNSFDAQGRVMYRVNTGSGNPYAFPNDDYIASLQNAFQTWEDVPTASIRFARGPDITTTSYATGFSMGFTSTGGNCQWGSSIGGAAGLTVYSYDGSNKFTDVDVCFSRQVSFSLDGANSNHFESTALHELGHAIGLDHDPHVQSTMSYVGTRDMHTPETTPYVAGRRALLNDKLAVSLIYPEAGWTATVGSLAGTLRYGSTNVHQGVVGAFDSMSGLLVATTLSRTGNYRFDALPPGTYILRTFPSIDGPYYYLNQHPSTLPWTSSGAPSSFLATGANDPSGVTVAAGTTTTAAISVSSGTVRQFYTDSVWRTASGAWGIGTMTLRAPRGASIRVGVSGLNNSSYDFPQTASQIQALEILGGGVAVSGGPYFSGSANGPPYSNAFAFDLAVAQNATPGIRALSVTAATDAGSQRFIVFGYLEVVDPGTLAVSVGPENPSARASSAGATDVVALQFALAPAGEPARMRAVTIRASGTGNDQTAISAVKLWRDVNQNGVIDPATDVQLGRPATYGANDGTVTIARLYETAPAGASTRYLVGYDFAASAGTGTTFRAEVTALVASGVDSGRPIGATGLPVAGSTITLGTAPSPQITLSPTSLSFSAVQGGPSPAPQTFTVQNSGPANSTLDFTVTDSAAWLTVSPSSGSLASGASSTITVTPDVAGLGPGTYAATITVAGAGATNSPQTVAVTLDVAPAPSIALSATAMTFSATAGGPAPPAQLFTVENAGASGSTLDFSVWDDAAWLTVSPSAGTLSSGASAAVIVSASPTGLAPGSYTALITVSDPLATNDPRSVSVTFNVAPAPVILLSPTSLAFAATVGGADPPAQSFAVTNGGLAGSTLSFSVSDDAPWLSVSPESGTLAAGASQSVTVRATVGGLSAGTYSATLTVSDPLASNNPRAVAVTFAVAHAPAIGLAPTSLSFSAVEGGADPAVQSLTVSNTGSAGSTLSFSASDDAAWLSLAPASGALADGASVAVTVSASVAGLAAGSYSATITVSDPGAVNNPRTVPVSLTVAPRPTISLSAASLSFRATEGGTDPPAQSLTVANSGPAGSTLAYALTSSASWLTVAPTSGTLGAGQSAASTVRASVASLAAGTYTGRLIVSDPLATNDPREVLVTLTLDPRPTIGLSATALSFSATEGGPSPAGQDVIVTNTAGPGSVLSFSVSDDAGWLSVSPASGTLQSGGSATVRVSAATGSLAAGSYAATVTVSDPQATNSPRAIAVSLTVAPRPTISLSPAALSFTATAGATDPSPQAFIIQNSGPAGSTLAFVVSDDAGWLAPSIASGTLTSGASRAVDAAVSVAGLAAGNYNATLTVSDPLATNSPRTIAVSLAVKPAPSIAVSPSALSFSAIEGGAAPAAQTFTLTNGGAAESVLSWSASDDAAWLSLSPASGTLSGGSSAPVTVSVSPAGLAAGTYTGTVTVSDPAAASGPRTVAVTFTVAPPAAISVSPDALSFSAAVGGASPAAKTFAVSNFGPAGSVLRFSVADDAPWLSASPASGTLASGQSTTITVTPSTQSLLAGNYAATVTVSDPAAQNSPAAVNVSLALVAAPTIALSPDALTFEQVLGGPDPAPQQIAVANAGTGGSTLRWTLSENAGWLSAAPAGGSLSAGAHAAVTVSASGTGLAAGTYATTLTVSDPAATNSPSTLPITFVVRPQASLALAPPSLAFEAVEGGADPAPRTFAVQNGGPAGSTLVWSASADATWLSLSPTSGALGAGASATVTARASVAALFAGSYGGTITVSDPLASGGSKTIPVSLLVRPRAWISVSPPSISVVAARGVNPAPRGFSLANDRAGAAPLAYTVASSQPWLSPSPAAGVLAPLASTSISLALSTAALAPGDYAATVTVSDPAAENSPRTVAINLRVADAPAAAIATGGPYGLATWTGAIEGTARDASGAGLAAVEVRVRRSSDGKFWDGAAWSDAPAWLATDGGSEWSLPFDPEDGVIYFVEARAIDRLGGVQDPPAAATFTADLAPPFTRISTQGGFTSATWTGAFQGTAADTASGVARVEVSVQRASDGLYWNGAAYGAGQVWKGAVGTTTWSYPFAPEDGQAYRIEARATDGMGNVEDPPASAVVSYSAEGPDSSIATAGLYGPATWPGAIRGSAWAGAGAAVSRVEVRVQRYEGAQSWTGSAWSGGDHWLTADGTTSWSVALGALDDGLSYRISSRAVDTSGAVEASLGFTTVTYDAAAPTSEIETAGDVAQEAWNGIWGTAADGLAGVEEVRVSLRRLSDGKWWDGEAWGPTALALGAKGTDRWSFSFAAESGTSYEVRSVAVDKVRNEQPRAAVATFRVVASPVRGGSPAGPAPGCGCGAAGGGAPEWALLVLGFLARRRRAADRPMGG